MVGWEQRGGRAMQTERKVGKVCTGRVRKCTSIRRVSAGWKVVGCALRGLGESKYIHREVFVVSGGRKMVMAMWVLEESGESIETGK